MFKSIYSKIALVVPSALAFVGLSANAQVTSSSLGASIDTVNTTWYDYFTTLLGHFWPFVVGVGVLLVVWHFGRRTLNSFN